MRCHVALNSTVLQAGVGGVFSFTLNVIRRATGIRFWILHDRPLTVSLPEHCVGVRLDNWSGRGWSSRQLALARTLKRLGHPIYWQPGNLGVPILTRSRVLLTVHDVIPASWEDYYADERRPRLARLQYKTRIQLGLWRADAITTDSAASKRDLARLFRVDSARIHVVPMGVALEPSAGERDREVLAQRGLAPGGYLLSHGGLNRRKNIEKLIAAYAAIHDLPSIRPLSLVLTGDVDLLPGRVTSVIADHDLGGKVMFTGRVSDDEMPTLVRQARAIVYPTLAEGFGLPLLEGLAAGVPVVASRLPVLVELGQDIPIYVDPDSTASIAAGVLQAVDMSTRADERRWRRGQARAAEFSWDRTASEMERLVRALGGGSQIGT